MNNLTNNLAPIVLFVYKRPEHTRQTIEALQKNTLAAQSELIVYADAAKHERDVPAVQQVRQYIRGIGGFKSITLIEQQQNQGLANSVIAGVTEVVNRYGRVIVLEDDLLTAPDFLEYMNRALERYEHAEQVMQISGYMFPVNVEMEEDSLFLPLTTSWGWATWKRAWDLFDPEAKGYAMVQSDKALRKRFNLDGAYDYFSMLEGQVAGKIDSWAVRWQLSAFLAGGLTLYPRYSLVKNLGFDGSGTHGVMRGLLSRSGTRDDFNPRLFPPDIATGAAWPIICESLRTRLPLLDRAKLRLRKLIRSGLAGMSGQKN